MRHPLPKAVVVNKTESALLKQVPVPEWKGGSQERGSGEWGIRTPDTAFGPYNGLANRRLQPLGQLSAGGTTNGIYRRYITKNGALWRIRTTDLLIRSQMLYPAELRARERGKVSNP